jgi:alpha-amylase/alpha-mannosidase (GH57 family)
MIMPLANFSDKVTQVKWGLADFKFRFGRNSEGIWLPETACNQETIEVLISEGVGYIILDPGQAGFVRKSDTSEWIDVNTAGIDPQIPYRCFSAINKNKFINIFFYDGPLSKAIAFDDVLFTSQNLLNKINQAGAVDTRDANLISASTDGETFGHHKKFTDRTLAHFLTVLAPENNIKIVNYGEYLEKHQPEHDVILRTGEGTSWSCPHGVKRWKEDCGCGSADGLNQKWRKPLRESLDWLRDQLLIIFNQQGSLYLKDVWEARNRYINVILNDLHETRSKFLTDNANRNLTPDESGICFKLLEMQKFAMFMFTSCGWFFSEISGIETVKILEYASCAIGLAKDITGINLEEEFLKRLSEAKSNIQNYGDGKNIYLDLVKQANI